MLCSQPGASQLDGMRAEVADLDVVQAEVQAVAGKAEAALVVVFVVVDQVVVLAVSVAQLVVVKVVVVVDSAEVFLAVAVSRAAVVSQAMMDQIPHHARSAQHL